MTMQSLTAIRVISLERAHERRAAFARDAGTTQRDWEFFAAHTTLSRSLQYDPAVVEGVYGRRLEPGEIGCYSSHFALWRWLLDSPYEQLLVLEDDVVVDWDFAREIAARPLSRQGIDYLRLFAKMPAPWRMVASPCFDPYRHLIRFTGYALGTQAYLLTRAGAEKLVRHGSRVEAPVDVFMDRTWDHGLLNLAIQPFPVYERHQRSSIGEVRLDAGGPLRNLRSLKALAIRLRRKLLLNWAIYGVAPASARSLQRLLRAPHA